MSALAQPHTVTAGEALAAVADLQGQHGNQLQKAIQLARGRAVPMHRMLAAICLQQGCTFSFRGREAAPQQVMAPEMFLPVVTATAQEDGHCLLGIDLGCGLRLEDECLFGVRSVVPHITGHIVDVWRGLFFLHAANKVFGLRPNASIDLTASYEVMNEQFRRLRKTLGSSEDEIPWPLPQRHN